MAGGVAPSHGSAKKPADDSPTPAAGATPVAATTPAGTAGVAGTAGTDAATAPPARGSFHPPPHRCRVRRPRLPLRRRRLRRSWSRSSPARRSRRARPSRSCQPPQQGCVSRGASADGFTGQGFGKGSG